MSTSFGPPGWSQDRPTAPAAAPELSLLVAPAAGMPSAPPPSMPPPRRPSTGEPHRVRVPADRRPLDARRLKAALFDSVLVALLPLGLLVTGGVLTDGAWLVFNAVALIYYFLCEVTTGQTVGKRLFGLRVVAQDGAPATAAQVSARTVLRLIDNSIVGILVMVLSGDRRQRLGDFLGRTVVIGAAPDPGRPPRSRLIVAYPAAWAASALIAFFAIGHGGDTYLAEIEDICERREQAVQEMPDPLPLEAALEVTRAEIDVLERLEPPAGRRTLHAELLQMRLTWLAEAELAAQRVDEKPSSAKAELTKLAKAAKPLDARFEQLGLGTCAQPAPELA